MSELGHFALLLGLFLSGYAVLIDLVGSWRQDIGFVRSGRNATVGCFACLSVAMLVLWVVLVRSDFGVTYVAEHSSRSLPLAYKISALWAGAAGSLLLWLWIQVGFVVVAYGRCGGVGRYFLADARALANFVNAFFFAILIFDRNPFELSAVVPRDGSGLNPLLQHPAMVLHPPILFVGYAGFLIPFAWAFGWLKLGPAGCDVPLLSKARRWTLVAWLFLTAGIALGAWWAYEELGWGGYWAWDPVENASLLPWLVSTALVHCFRTYRPRSSIAGWIIVLSSLTFSLCVFGRFLTKYGLVSSVHSFAEPGLGILYIVLLISVWLVGAGLIVRNRVRKRKRGVEEAAGVNKFILLNNWLLILLMLVIFVGTLFPFLSGVFLKIASVISGGAVHAGHVISLAPEFFTKVTAPGGLLLLLLLGLCPHLVGQGLKRHWRSLLALAAVMGAAGAWLVSCSLDRPVPGGVLGALGWAGQWLLSGSPAIPCLVFCGLIVVNVVADLVQYERRRSAGKRSGRGGPRNLRWYGSRIVHLGVALVFIGIAGSGGYDTEKTVALRPMEKTNITRYELTFEDLMAEHGPNFTAVTAVMSVRSGGRMIATLKPARAYYSPGGKIISEVDVRRTLAGDLYLALTDVDQAGGLINLHIMVKPLINWIWVGVCVMILGVAMLLIWPYRLRIRSRGDDREEWR